MSYRFLVMAERAEHRALVAKHVEVEWPDALVIEHALGVDPPLDPAFTALGCDAVVVVGSQPGDAAQVLVRELAERAVFAPLVEVRLEDAAAGGAPPPPRVQRLVGRKLDRYALLDALKGASREQRNAQTARRTKPDFNTAHRFGPIAIRGHRCVKQIGSGGMCTVYLAESERAAAMVVLKVFQQVPDVSERHISFDRFLQEYEIVARVKHENVVRIYDLGVADDHAYIAMEHFPAGDLRLRMKSPIAPRVALGIVAQMASALRAIHAVGVLHRDLKPGNVMLRTNGDICLIDFGLAKTIGFDAELTGAREIFGTPYYMSPEQGHAEETDERSDLYSIGIMFFEMLTGRKPYLGNNAMEVIFKHRKAPLPDLPPELAQFQPIVHRLFAKAPADRFQSAELLLQAVESLQKTP